jgi:hypothetical protein
LRCQCLVPCLTSGTSEIHWPFCQSNGLSVCPFLSNIRRSGSSPLLYKTDSVHDCLNTARVICTLNNAAKINHLLSRAGSHTWGPTILCLTHVSGDTGVAEPAELQGVCCCQTPWVICALLLSAGWIYNIVSGNLAHVSGSYWYEVLGPRSHGCTNIHLTEWIC